MVGSKRDKPCQTEKEWSVNCLSPESRSQVPKLAISLFLVVVFTNNSTDIRSWLIAHVRKIASHLSPISLLFYKWAFAFTRRMVPLDLKDSCATVQVFFITVKTATEHCKRVQLIDGYTLHTEALYRRLTNITSQSSLSLQNPTMNYGCGASSWLAKARTIDSHLISGMNHWNYRNNWRILSTSVVGPTFSHRSFQPSRSGNGKRVFLLSIS